MERLYPLPSSKPETRNSQMYLCKVTGSVVAPEKHEVFRTSKLLVVQPVDLDGEERDVPDMLALDPRYGAGVGDYVLVVREGKAVQQIMETDDISANVIIVGVVDEWDVEVAE